MSESEDSEIDVDSLQETIQPKPLFATVRFDSYEKNKLYQIPVTDIKIKIKNKDGIPVLIPYAPQNTSDFDPHMLYHRVKWQCPIDCPEEHNNKHYEYYKANIINLGKNKQECVLKTEGSRCRFKTAISDVSGTTMSSSENNNDQDFSKDIQTEFAKKAQEAMGKRIIDKSITVDDFLKKRLRLDNIIENVDNIKKQKPIIRKIETIHPLQENRILEKESPAIPCSSRNNENRGDVCTQGSSSSRTLNLSQQQKENYMDAFKIMQSASKSPLINKLAKVPCSPTKNFDFYNEDRYENDQHLKCGINDHNEDTDEIMEPLRENHRDQNIIPNIGNVLKSHTRRPKKLEYTMPPAKINLTPEGIMYAKVNDGNQVYLGLDVYVDEDVWARMLSKKNRPTIFLRELAEVIWLRENLVMRAFDVDSCKAVAPGIEGPRIPFEEDKWQLLIALYTNYLNDLKKVNSAIDVQSYLKMVPKIIKQKIHDCRASLRREEANQQLNKCTKNKPIKKPYIYIDHHHQNV